jgi:hypothetical protein
MALNNAPNNPPNHHPNSSNNKQLPPRLQALLEEEGRSRHTWWTVPVAPSAVPPPIMAPIPPDPQPKKRRQRAKTLVNERPEFREVHPSVFMAVKADHEVDQMIANNLKARVATMKNELGGEEKREAWEKLREKQRAEREERELAELKEFWANKREILEKEGAFSEELAEPKEKGDKLIAGLEKADTSSEEQTD